MTAGTLPRVRRSDPRYEKLRRIERARGVDAYVDAGPACDHVQRLIAAGVAANDIARACGLSGTTVRNIAAGRHERLQSRTAQVVLTVSPDSAALAAPLVPGIGTLRRVQALLAIGHTHDTIDTYGLFSRSITQFKPHRVTRRVAAAAAAAYDALWDQPGTAPVHTRSQIAALGYAPPLAWDDDTIDDPAARPASATAGRRGRFVLEDAELLASAGCTSAVAAARLGVTRGALLRRIGPGRADRPDLVRWFAINDRAAGLLPVPGGGRDTGRRNVATSAA